jgi:hypothetical protein
MTLIKVKNAETVASLESASKVRGSEQVNETTAPIAKPTAQIEWPETTQLRIGFGLQSLT